MKDRLVCVLYGQIAKRLKAFISGMLRSEVKFSLKSVVIMLYFINPRTSIRDSALLKVTSAGQMFVLNAFSVFIFSLTKQEL